MADNVKEKSEKKTGAVSMRLRPAEQKMFEEMAKRYGLYGATNAVRAAGRVLAMLNLPQSELIEWLSMYDTKHPEEEPVRWALIEEE